MKLELKTLAQLKKIELLGDKFYIPKIKTPEGSFGPPPLFPKEQEVIKLWRISREKGEFLHSLVTTNNCRQILELGTSVGYSTLFFGDAVKQTKGEVKSIEVMSEKVGLARKNLESAGLEKFVKIINANIMDYMHKHNTKIDFLFMDANKSQYIEYYNSLSKFLTTKALIFADNILKEKTAPFVDKIRVDLDNGKITEYEINYAEDYLIARYK